MENVENSKSGYAIVTYRIRLYDRHFDWMKETKELYVRAVRHFFLVLKKEPALLEHSRFLLLRELETRCIGTKEMKAAGIQPPCPLEGFPKLPLYFRRSAINKAIELARKNAKVIEPNIVLYKGMYQNFTDKSIEIKLYNGRKWVWVSYPFAGRELPQEVERLSPLLVLEKKDAWLEVPVSFTVEDVRTVRERMETEECICALAFPDNDTLAVAVLLSRDGKKLDSCFFHGGNIKKGQRGRILSRIRASEKSRGIKTRAAAWKEENPEQVVNTNAKESSMEEGCQQVQEASQKFIEPFKENSSLYEELHDLNCYYAHTISRRILRYCEKKNIKVIVVPNYEARIDFRDKRYLSTDAYRWLGRSIIKKLKYKAFQHGIIVTSVKPYHVSDCCSECGAKIRKYNEGHAAGENYHGGKLFKCPNGHGGNTAENTAKNIGKMFLSYFPEKSEG